MTTQLTYQVEKMIKNTFFGKVFQNEMHPLSRKTLYTGSKEEVYCRLNSICNRCKNNLMYDQESKDYYCVVCDS